MNVKRGKCRRKESGDKTESPVKSVEKKLSEDTQSPAKCDKSFSGKKQSKPALLLSQSASQPPPSPRSNSTGSLSSGATQPVGGTMGPAVEPSRKPAKRPRTMFGVAASGGCPKCEQVRRELNCEIANLKKSRVVEKRKLEQEIVELK